MKLLKVLVTLIVYLKPEKTQISELIIWFSWLTVIFSSVFNHFISLQLSPFIVVYQL